jgi:hypothetical protein
MPSLWRAMRVRCNLLFGQAIAVCLVPARDPVHRNTACFCHHYGWQMWHPIMDMSLLVDSIPFHLSHRHSSEPPWQETQALVDVRG